MATMGRFDQFIEDGDEDFQFLRGAVRPLPEGFPVFVMNSTTTEKTIEKLRRVFASYGLPDEVVTDNGPQFTAKDFTEFLRKNGMRHTRTPP
ncbi:hypothetical protein MTO96_041314 [Rhipicephalus appendiculatus]